MGMVPGANLVSAIALRKKKMRATRESRLLSDVIEDVKQELAIEHGFGQDRIDAERRRVDTAGKSFPIGSFMVPISKLSIDYTVQRDVIIKHILSIVKRYNPQICSPASAVTDKYDGKHPIYVYDGQHRIVATGVLGFTEIPIIINEDSEPSFPSYAFEECNMSTKKLSFFDIHRNRLTRHKLGATEQEVIFAKRLQDAFDRTNVDLEDKATRKSKNLRGNSPYYFSHFDYAYKGIEADHTGVLVSDILEAITTAYPSDEEISQDLYVGLLELHRQPHDKFPRDWMKDVLTVCAKTFPSCTTVKQTSLYKEKAKMQLKHISPGSSWNAPRHMSNFLRELYIVNGGKLNLPHHGTGASMQLETNPGNFVLPRALTDKIRREVEAAKEAKAKKEEERSPIDFSNVKILK
jgi:hypothetical protein